MGVLPSAPNVTPPVLSWLINHLNAGTGSFLLGPCPPRCAPGRIESSAARTHRVAAALVEHAERSRAGSGWPVVVNPVPAAAAGPATYTRAGVNNVATTVTTASEARCLAMRRRLGVLPADSNIEYSP